MDNSNQIYFAVTDFDEIIPLKEIYREVYVHDNLTRIITKIYGFVENPQHCEAHHRIYFKELWLNDAGEPDKRNVFVRRMDAIEWARKAVNTKIAGKQRELRQLQQKLNYLNMMIGD